MALITKYRLFERGDEDEIELGPKIKMKLGPDGKYSMISQTPDPTFDYVLSLPSGEVLLIDDVDVFKRVTDKGLASYTYSFKGKVLNCYVCRDDEFDKVREYVEEITKNRKVDDKTIDVCKEFSKEMSKILKKKHVIAYIENINNLKMNYYYLIIPDLEINKSYYKQKNTDMLTVLQNMKAKYPNSVFAYTERLHRSDVRYYGLPDRYDQKGNIKKEEPKKETLRPTLRSSSKRKNPAEVCNEIKDKVSKITKRNYDLEHYYREDGDFSYFNIPPKDISFFDNFGKTKTNFLIYKFSEAYPYMEIGWLSDSNSAKKWESGIFVRPKEINIEENKLEISREIKEELSKLTKNPYKVGVGTKSNTYYIVGDRTYLQGDELNKILSVLKQMQQKYPDKRFEWIHGHSGLQFIKDRCDGNVDIVEKLPDASSVLPGVPF